MGNINIFLARMVFMFDESMSNDLNEPLAKLCAIEHKYY